VLKSRYDFCRGRYTVVLHFAEFYYGPQVPGGGGAGSSNNATVSGMEVLDESN